MNCAECLRPLRAITTKWGDGPDASPLCLECADKVRQIEDLRLRQLEAEERHADFVADELDSVFGVGRTGPRFRDSPTRPPAATPTFNNITVKDSVVGAINTGTAHRIDVAISRARVSGHPELGQAIQRLTEAIVNASDLSEQARHDALESVETLSGAGTSEGRTHNKGTLKAIVEGLGQILNGSASAVTVWQAIKPVILTALHLL